MKRSLILSMATTIVALPSYWIEREVRLLQLRLRRAAHAQRWQVRLPFLLHRVLAITRALTQKYFES